MTKAKATRALEIRDQHIIALAAQLATIRKSSTIDAVRAALENELTRILDIDLDEFEKRLRAAGAPSSAIEDPVAELARFVEASRPKAAGAPEGATLLEKLRPLQDRVASRAPTGLKADKAFYDELSGEL